MQVRPLGLRKGEDRAAPVSRGDRLLVGKKCFVEIGRREVQVIADSINVLDLGPLAE